MMLRKMHYQKGTYEIDDINKSLNKKVEERNKTNIDEERTRVLL